MEDTSEQTRARHGSTRKVEGRPAEAIDILSDLQKAYESPSFWASIFFVHVVLGYLQVQGPYNFYTSVY